MCNNTYPSTSFKSGTLGCEGARGAEIGSQIRSDLGTDCVFIVDQRRSREWRCFLHHPVRPSSWFHEAEYRGTEVSMYVAQNSLLSIRSDHDIQYCDSKSHKATPARHDSSMSGSDLLYVVITSQSRRHTTSCIDAT